VVLALGDVPFDIARFNRGMNLIYITVFVSEIVPAETVDYLNVGS
jgi:hypothetical protein